MNWFQRAIKRLYIRYCSDEVIESFIKSLSEHHEEISHLRHLLDTALAREGALREVVSKYDDCVPLPSAPTPEAMKIMLAKIAEKEKARQPIDCTDLYLALVEYCRGRKLE